MQHELSIEADEDLENICDFTYNEFGSAQAAKYVSSFDDLFEKTGKNSMIGWERDEIRLDLRSMLKESHVVFYRILNDKIRIVRILHGSVDLPRHFKDISG